MKTYIQDFLEPNETVEYVGHPTWWSHFFALLFVAITVLPTFGLTLIVFLIVYIEVKTTEYVVTNRRVLRKRGWLRRDVDEIRLKKVESVKIDQSITGRILKFSTIKVIGTGGSVVELKGCTNGVELKNKIHAVGDL